MGPGAVLGSYFGMLVLSAVEILNILNVTRKMAAAMRSLTTSTVASLFLTCHKDTIRDAILTCARKPT